MNLNDYFDTTDERPLDRPVTDGGYAGIFRTVAFVGDSLSSGEFEAIDADGNKTYHDYYDYSWGQYMARMAGFTAYNFSRGGMTAREYCDSFAEERGFWNPDLAAQAYVVALGVNDVLNQGHEVGTMADICDEDWHKNANTFAGRYGEIIQRYREIRPDGYFFLMTMPKGDRGKGPDAGKDAIADRHAELLYEMAAHFPNTYVLDLRKYAVEYDEAFREKFFLGGHMNPAGYILTAKMVLSYMDFIIRHNMDDFKQVGFIGTPFRWRPV